MNDRSSMFILPVSDIFNPDQQLFSGLQHAGEVHSSLTGPL